MDQSLFKVKRKSYIELGQLYFWTATINNWMRLLEREEYKKIIVQSLQHLSVEGKIDVFGFVIMPNHIHLIWRINEMNGKETTQGSFLKYTAHQFKKTLRKQHEIALSAYWVKANNKEYEFWQRDSLAVHLFSKEVAFQKLDYLHHNPIAKHWQLVSEPTEYLYSSALYYETGESNFSFLQDLRQEF